MFTESIIEKLSRSIFGNNAVELAKKDANDANKISLSILKKMLLAKKLRISSFRLRKSKFEEFCRVCSEYAAPVTAPLILISQIQRSGGSLLSQLFDGHPEIHAHPHELKIGYPRKYIWPKLELDESPKRWFDILFEDQVVRHFQSGYKKERKQDESFPFIFSPPVQRMIFLQYLNGITSKVTEREILNAYMTSYFGAWLDNKNIYGTKKYITGFTPRLAMRSDNMESFFDIYPDGKLISVVRDPKDWFASATRHSPKYRDVKNSIELWKKSTEGSLRNQESYGENARILSFRDLVTKTELVMRYLCDFLEIQFDEIMLMPTFNGRPIKANTSFTAEKYGVVKKTLNRGSTLNREQLAVIEDASGDLYKRALTRTVKV